MLRSLLFALLVCSTSLLHAQKPVWTFGMSLSPQHNGQLFSLFLVQVQDGKIISKRSIERKIFIQQAQGRMESLANPDKEDFFRKAGIGMCTVHPDSTAMGYWVGDCDMFDEIWKLRYSESPHGGPGYERQQPGWAHHPIRPSDSQLVILSQFGITSVNGIAYGFDVFRLFHAILDPAWIAAYRGS